MRCVRKRSALRCAISLAVLLLCGAVVRNAVTHFVKVSEHDAADEMFLESEQHECILANSTLCSEWCVLARLHTMAQSCHDASNVIPAHTRNASSASWVIGSLPGGLSVLRFRSDALGRIASCSLRWNSVIGGFSDDPQQPPVARNTSHSVCRELAADVAQVATTSGKAQTKAGNLWPAHVTFHSESLIRRLFDGCDDLRLDLATTPLPRRNVTSLLLVGIFTGGGCEWSGHCMQHLLTFLGAMHSAAMVATTYSMIRMAVVVPEFGDAGVKKRFYRFLDEYLAFLKETHEHVSLCPVPLSNDVWSLQGSTHPALTEIQFLVPRAPDIGNFFCSVCQEIGTLTAWRSATNRRGTQFSSRRRTTTMSNRVVAIIKHDRSLVASTSRYFNVTDRSKRWLEELGVVLLPEDVSKAERMWHIARADVLIDSSGANMDINSMLMHPLMRMKRRMTIVHPQSEMNSIHHADEGSSGRKRSSLALNDSVMITNVSFLSLLHSNIGGCRMFEEFGALRTSREDLGWWVYFPGTSNLDDHRLQIEAVISPP